MGMKIRLTSQVILPVAGAACVLLAWALVSTTVAPDLPSPLKTWQASKVTE